ncbi:hypothetical protein [Microbacterium sp. P5_E9]
MSDPLGGRGDDARRRPVIRRPLTPAILAAQQTADEVRFCTDAVDLVQANRRALVSRLVSDDIGRVQQHDVLTQWTPGAAPNRGTVDFEGNAAQFDQRIVDLDRVIDDVRGSLALTATLLLGDFTAIDRGRFFRAALVLLTSDVAALRAMRPFIPALAPVQLHRVETTWSFGSSPDAGAETLTGDHAAVIARLTACNDLLRDLLIRIERLAPNEERPTSDVQFPENPISGTVGR